MGKTHKLLPKFNGPFEVIEEINPVSYRVQNEKKVFLAHVQRLLPYNAWDGGNVKN